MHSPESPSVAIILINKDDPGVIDTLEALVALPQVLAGAAEVIVVDASEGRFERLRVLFPVVRWIEFAPIPGRSSIPQQRNRALSETDAETIVFTDASCVPGPEWLERLCGPIWHEDESLVAGSARSPAGHSLRDVAAQRIVHCRYLTEAPTINLAVKVSVCERLGGFDERFQYGSDVDFTWRAIDAGYRIRYVREAFVTHDWGDLRAEVRRSHMYGRARARLYLKHRGRRRNLLGSDFTAVAYPLVLLAAPLFVRRPYALSVFAIPLVRNRGMRPFLTVAEHLIYGAGVLQELIDWTAQRRPGASPPPFSGVESVPAAESSNCRDDHVRRQPGDSQTPDHELVRRSE
jgi:hypothetical protein